MIKQQYGEPEREYLLRKIAAQAASLLKNMTAYEVDYQEITLFKGSAYYEIEQVAKAALERREALALERAKE